MTRALFVTSSGTGLGKTYVTALLCRQLRETGRAVRAVKPVLSGFSEGEAASSDAGVILTALGREVTTAAIESVSPWRYRAALAPDRAAAREGRVVPFEQVAGFCRKVLAEPSDTVLIEGVGGVMAPISADKLNIDLMAALEIPALLVVGSYLGTISHTLTALSALAARRVPIAGVVVSQSPDAPLDLEETVAAISRLVGSAPVTGLSRLARWHEQPDVTSLLEDRNSAP